jgi:peptidoglycan L-alanyl-D-glutamate endopeptidase CwlK
MDARSEHCLEGVHPDLARVIRAAAERSAVPFMVIHGLRTLAEERRELASGASQTLHSRHLPNTEGYACAVDVAALRDGHVSWDPRLYRTIAEAVKAAAWDQHHRVEWGGNWRSLKDYGHFQLPWSDYP